MADWILFAVGLAIFLAFSAVLNAFFLGTFIAGMKRYMLGRIIAGAVKGTRIDREAAHRTMGAFGLQTRNSELGDVELDRLRPKRWQETLAWVCYAGTGLGFALMIYAIAR